MILKKVITQLEEFCPPDFAEKWDNPGLQVGASDQEIKRVFIALDCTSEVIEEAIRQKADLILTHHPLLFNGIKKVNDQDFIGKRIVKMIQNNISCYAMHTNFDVMGMASEASDELRLIGADVLEVTYEDAISHEGLGRIGELPEHMTLQECAVYVKETFRIPHVRFYGDPEQPIVMCAILPGSGKDEIDLARSAGADVMITGDITHHVGLDAVEKGIAVIDAGHYGVEKLFVPYMQNFLERELSELDVICAKEQEPFTEV